MLRDATESPFPPATLINDNRRWSPLPRTKLGVILFLLLLYSSTLVLSFFYCFDRFFIWLKGRSRGNEYEGVIVTVFLRNGHRSIINYDVPKCLGAQLQTDFV